MTSLLHRNERKTGLIFQTEIEANLLSELLGCHQPCNHTILFGHTLQFRNAIVVGSHFLLPKFLDNFHRFAKEMGRFGENFWMGPAKEFQDPGLLQVFLVRVEEHVWQWRKGVHPLLVSQPLSGRHRKLAGGDQAGCEFEHGQGHQSLNPVKDGMLFVTSQNDAKMFVHPSLLLQAFARNPLLIVNFVFAELHDQIAANAFGQVGQTSGNNLTKVPVDIGELVGQKESQSEAQHKMVMHHLEDGLQQKIGENVLDTGQR